VVINNAGILRGSYLPDLLNQDLDELTLCIDAVRPRPAAMI
jgi:hypothetical protein